jgi:hypothetical protein
MKDLVRAILRENSHLETLKKYFWGTWANQVKSGEIPRLNYIDLQRKKLSKYIEQIDQWYREFVGGEDEAFKLFDSYMTNLTVTDDDLRKVGQNLNPNDKFEVVITRIFNDSYDKNNTKSELEFGFVVKDASLLTDEGILTWDELSDERYDNLWHDIENWLRGELEGYVHTLQLDFGLDYLYINSQWDD